MIIALIIIALIIIAFLSKSTNDKEPKQTASFETAFACQLGQDPVSYISCKLNSGSDLGAIRYLFEIIEAEIEKKSKCKSPGFEFYYTKVMCKQGPIPSVSQVPSTKTIEITSSSKSPRHRWTMAEDVLCCRRFFEQYVIRHSSMDVQFFAQQLHKELPDISVGSLKMKSQNIQKLCIEYGVKSSFAAKPLAQYSQQNHHAFMQVKQEYGLK